MIAFLRAHGLDPGPLQRPILAGLISGLVASAPAGLVAVALGSFQVAADQILRLPRPLAALLLAGAFAASGALYGLALRRAANDVRGGWLFGAAFGFVLWMAAPITVSPLLGDGLMAAGRAATGFFAAFLVWGLVVGAIFPLAHRPLRGRLDRTGHGEVRKLGSAAARNLLRRPPR